MAAHFVAPPRSAYLHVPFCSHRCGYCDFTLVARRDELIDAYLDALAIDLARLQEPRKVETIFFGGGTPTHLPAVQLERLMELALRGFGLPRGPRSASRPTRPDSMMRRSPFWPRPASIA